MKYLFKITLKNSLNRFDARTLYVIEISKQEAINYLNQWLRDPYIINKVYCLGHELSSTMYESGKENRF
jgi:hypothetical protein